jgi:DNA repair protein RadC
MNYSLRTVTWRFHESKEVSSVIPATIYGPQDLFVYYKDLFKGQVRERFVVFWLSTANKVMGFEVITEGTLNSSLAHPREVFRGAIVTTSAAVILAHNHPSGNPEPSSEDIQLSKQIVEAGKIVGIPVHDHIIFTDDTYTSLAERGLL